MAYYNSYWFSFNERCKMTESLITAQLSQYGLPFAPVQSNPGNSRVYNYLGQEFQILINPEQTGGTFGLLHMEEKKGMEPPPHIHTREDEVYFIQSGAITYNVSGTRYECIAGDVMFLPRNCVHSFEVITPTSEVLNLIMPGNFINYFLEMSAIRDVPQAPLSTVFMEKLVATATKYGIRFPHLEKQ
jgi:quercetin dioxygenase-like cupin family protein